MLASILGGAVQNMWFHTEKIMIYVSNKTEESKMFEKITVGIIKKIYIIYVTFNIKEN